MSTHSRIGILNLNDGSVRSVYCQSDGYLEHNGKILITSYTSEKTVNELIYLGDLNSLADTPKSSRNYHDWRNEELRIETSKSIHHYLHELAEAYMYLFVPRVNQWFTDKKIYNRPEYTPCAVNGLTVLDEGFISAFKFQARNY